MDTGENNRPNMLRLYRDWRMAKIFFLGFISGFPWLLIASMVALWLKEEGLSRSGIGLFGLVFGVYAINALWAPVIDGIKIPFLSKMFGQRRAWIILMQIVIAVCMLCIFLLPSVNGYLGIFENFPPLLNLLTQYGDSWWAKSILILDSRLFYLALLVFIIATASATQDVAIDATRIEMIKTEEPEKISAGSAMATSGWWLGFGGGKALALPFVQLLQEAGIVNAWQSGYLALTVIVILCIMGVIFFIRVPGGPSPPPPTQESMALRAVKLYANPLMSFVRRYTLSLAILLLFFIFFFKIGEAFLGRMSLVFYKEVGFTKTEIGLLSGGLGTITVCVFSILGSFVNARYGLLKGLFLGGIAMAATNLFLAALAIWPSKELFAVAVVADQFTTAVSTVAFVAFLSQLCDRGVYGDTICGIGIHRQSFAHDFGGGQWLYC